MADRMERLGLIVAVALMLFGAAPSRAELGCVDLSNVAQQQGPGPAFVASCDVDEDCAAVGGVACTSGLCACVDEGVDFCPCAATDPGAAMAPAMTPVGLAALVGVLGALGLFGVWRRSTGV